MSEYNEIVEIIDRVMMLMGWSEGRACTWCAAKNPLLGGASPRDLVRSGRGHRVLQFIAAAEDENRPSRPSKS